MKMSNDAIIELFEAWMVSKFGDEVKPFLAEREENGVYTDDHIHSTCVGFIAGVQIKAELVAINDKSNQLH